MKTLGLIGGISWVSTIDYYRAINLGINERLGGLQFPRCIIHSFNYADSKQHGDSNEWEWVFGGIIAASENMKAAGASAILLCANTMHMFAERLEAAIRLPIIHIATETAADIKRAGLQKAGLLGTKPTMERDFSKDKLTAQGIEAIIPNEDDRASIHASIFDEPGKGIVTQATKQRYLAIIEKLIQEGAEGIILGCTEIPLLIQPSDVSVPSFDTTLIHSAAAVRFAPA